MRGEQLLLTYMEKMSDTVNSIDGIEEAFAPVAEAYQIAQLRGYFSVEPILAEGKDEDGEVVLFQSGDSVENGPVYNRRYPVKEKGEIVFSLCRKSKSPVFTGEEKAQLNPFLDYLFVHFDRFRLSHTLKEMGMTDISTGLPNTRGFARYAQELIRTKEIVQYNGFFFNLSHFSLVNKRFGGKESDLILARYAKIVREFLHDGECVARLGGDNFMALIRKERTQEFLHFLSGVKMYGVIREQEYTVIISAIAGVCDIDETMKDSGSIIDNCAVALHSARYIEKKAYVFASEKIKEAIYAEKKCMTDFDRAIRCREFLPYYQPKVNTDDFSMVGAEALVRWNRNGKIIYPSEFVPVYERSGIICQLDFYVFEQVCKDIRGWLDAGIEPVRISMNFSRKHLSNPDLADDIIEILQKYNVDSRYIEIELTETVDAEETEEIVHFMNEMKKRNISMAVDDFGTGYSSLNLLRFFPVDVLKIDKTFIDTRGENDRIVLSNIIRMANQLRMDVVAEGVETCSQMEYLREMNCKVIQGFLFDRPMPKEAFERKLVEGKYEKIDL